jgi:hypothetical protein
MEGEGFEPSKAEPSDLQSDPFDRSGTPPERVKRAPSTFEFRLSFFVLLGRKERTKVEIRK